MAESECIVNNLLQEIDFLSSRIKNIQQTYLHTSNDRLKERLIIENKSIIERVNEISSIANLLKSSSNEQLSFSKILLEICNRIIIDTKLKRNLFI